MTLNACSASMPLSLTSFDLTRSASSNALDAECISRTKDFLTTSGAIVMPISPIDRFMAKCRVEGSCIVWTGATYRSGDKRSPGLWYEGKRWPARRWYAIHVKGMDVRDWMNVEQGCANPLCVRHGKLNDPGIGRNYQRQAYLLNALFPEHQE